MDSVHSNSETDRLAKARESSVPSAAELRWVEKLLLCRRWWNEMVRSFLSIAHNGWEQAGKKERERTLDRDSRTAAVFTILQTI